MVAVRTLPQATRQAARPPLLARAARAGRAVRGCPPSAATFDGEQSAWDAAAHVAAGYEPHAALPADLEPATPTATPPPAPPAPDLSHLVGRIRVVGVGPRGASAARHLAADSALRAAGALLTAADSDAAALAAAADEAGGLCEALHLRAASRGGTPLLTAADMAQLTAGVAAAPPGALAGAHPNTHSDAGGMALVLGAACGTPGPAALASVAAALSAAGATTFAAVAAPFGFEGTSALSAARDGMDALARVCTACVVVDQGVLAAPPPPGAPAITMADAVAISDAALLSAGAALAAAVAAGDLLAVDADGSATWHARGGRRASRAPLAPPLATVLAAAGGPAVPGRGVATLPGGPPGADALACLAADAVRAAAESPFLTAAADAGGTAAALLGVVRLPLSDGALSRANARTAVQAAAAAAADAVPAAKAVFVYTPLQADAESVPGEARVEVSLLAAYGAPVAVGDGGVARSATSVALPVVPQDAVQLPAQPASTPPAAPPRTIADALAAAAAGVSTPVGSGTGVTAGGGPQSAWAAASSPRQQAPTYVQPQSTYAAPPPLPPHPPVAAPPPPPQPVAAVPPPSAPPPPPVPLAELPTPAVPTSVSLDLPPAAAAWRVRQRTPLAPRLRYLPAADAGWDGDDDDDDAPRGAAGLGAAVLGLVRRGGTGGPPQSVPLRDRVAGMLERERDI